MRGDTPPPPGPVIVDVGTAQARQMIVGSAVAGGIGVVAVAAALTGDVEGGTGTRVTAFLIGAVFTLIGALPLLLRRIAFRPRRLLFDSTGLRWEDPQGAPWAVGWAELAEVTLGYPAPAAGSARLGSAVNLTLRPADPAFHEAHPEMEHLAVPAGDGSRSYRVPFGHALSVVGPADRALRHYAPGVYRREGPEIPAPRDRPTAVKVSVAIVGCYWACAMAVALVMDASLSTLGMAALWTVVVALWLGRVWAGGALAVARMAGLAQVIGVLGLVTLGMLGLILLPMTDGPVARLLPAFLPGLATTAALLVSGRLLSRDDVRAWTVSRTWGL